MLLNYKNKIMEYAPTSHNRIVCAAPPYGGLAYKKPQSGLRPFVRFFSGTFFCALKPLRGFFIGRKKTSHTTGTLYAICPKIGLRYCIKNIQKILKKSLT
jgi:hypothetical protein